MYAMHYTLQYIKTIASFSILGEFDDDDDDDWIRCFKLPSSLRITQTQRATIHRLPDYDECSMLPTYVRTYLS